MVIRPQSALTSAYGAAALLTACVFQEAVEALPSSWFYPDTMGRFNGSRLDPPANWVYTVPNIEDCANSNTEASLYSKNSVNQATGSNVVVEWVKPNCAIGGSEIRVNTFLTAVNEGQLGLGQGDCANAGRIELIHKLNNSWAAFWYLFYPGTYAVCFCPNCVPDSTATPVWNLQMKVHLLEPNPTHCGYIKGPTFDATSHPYGHVYCIIPSGTPIKFFDGFYNEHIFKHSMCMPDCASCLAEGGKCRCHPDGEPTTENTCAACNLCTPAQLAGGDCSCGPAAGDPLLAPLARRRLQRNGNATQRTQRTQRARARRIRRTQRPGLWGGFWDALDLTYFVVGVWAAEGSYALTKLFTRVSSKAVEGSYELTKLFTYVSSYLAGISAPTFTSDIFSGATDFFSAYLPGRVGSS